MKAVKSSATVSACSTDHRYWRGLVGKAKHGGATGGKTLGYVREQNGTDASADHLVVDANDAILVQRIFEFYADGASLKQICNVINAEACGNASIRIDQLESRVLAGLREQLLTSDIIGKFARALQQELDDQQHQADAGAGELQARLVDIHERMARLPKRIEEDEDAPRMLISRLKALEAEEADLAAAVTAAPARTVVRLPTNYELNHQRAVEQLEEHLRCDDSNAAREAIRVLIDKVVVQPGDERGGKRRDVQLYGDLFQMLDFASTVSGRDTPEMPRGRNAQQPRSVGTRAACVTPLVAGTGFTRKRTLTHLAA